MRTPAGTRGTHRRPEVVQVQDATTSGQPESVTASVPAIAMHAQTLLIESIPTDDRKRLTPVLTTPRHKVRLTSYNTLWRALFLAALARPATVGVAPWVGRPFLHQPPAIIWS